MSRRKKLENINIPVTMERLNSTHAELAPDIQKKYGTDPAKLEMAEKCVYYSKKYMWERPIGCNANFRMSDLQEEMAEYVNKAIEEESKKTGPDAPKAFFGILAFWVIGGIVSWIVQRFLTKYFDKD